MKIHKILLTGVKQVYQVKKYIAVAYSINLVIALILGVILASAIQESVGASLAGEKLTQSFDDTWFRSFSVEAKGIAASFRPSVVGIGAVFDGLETFSRGNFFGQNSGLLLLAAIYWAIWVYLSAGFIGQFSHPLNNFTGQAGKFFLRFLIISGAAGLLYWIILGKLLPVLDKTLTTFTRDTIDERLVFFYTLAKYGIVWLLVYLVNIISDYSKIILLDGEIPLRKIYRAPGAALKFILKQPFRVAGLFISTGLIWVLLGGLYWLFAPGANQSSWITISLAFLIGQIYLLARISTRCLFYASETIFYKNH